MEPADLKTVGGNPRRFESCSLRHLSPPAESNRTIADLIAEARPLLPQTKGYPSLIHIVESRLGVIPLAALGPREVATFLTTRKAEASGPTANRARAMLSGLMRLAVDWEYVANNPVARVKPFRENPPRIRYLSTAEANRLLSACEAPWLRLIVMADLLTAARKGELLRLEWSAVDLDRGLVTFIKTKNGHNRTIPLHVTLGNALEELPDREGSVFRGPDGQRVGKSALRYAFEAAVRRAGLVPFRFHDCRHAAISFLVQAGVPLATVQMIGGWTTIGMVLRYGHLAPQHLKAAVEALPAFTTTQIALTSDPAGRSSSPR